jgi:hypothetical protein
MFMSRRMRCSGYVARMGEKRNACKVSVGKSEGKRPLEDSRAGGRIFYILGYDGVGWG